MPDAEIIPQIADVLNVSIDTLYGHKTSEKEDIFEAIIKEFDEKDDNRFDKAYQMAWLSALAAFSPKSVMELIGKRSPVITKTNGLENLAQLSSKWGYMIGNLTIDSQFMMLVKKRECFKDLVMQKEDYVSLFGLLASEKVIDILSNGHKKLFKSPSEGLMVVKLSGVNLTPKTNVGRLIYDFSATVTEVGRFNVESLDDFDLKEIRNVRYFKRF